jgi:hypothetical protein
MAYVCSDFASYILTVYENSLEDGWITYVKANAVQWSSFHTPLHSGVDGMLQVLPRMVLNVTLEDIWYLIAVFYMCSFYCSVLPVHDSFLEKKHEIDLCCSQVQVDSCWYFDLRRSLKQHLPL